MVRAPFSAVFGADADAAVAFDENLGGTRPIDDFTAERRDATGDGLGECQRPTQGIASVLSALDGEAHEERGDRRLGD